MPKPDPLHELIKSLTTAEKRAFKMQHKPKENDTPNHYFELFKILDSQKEYDEKKIREIINHPKFVLSNAKNHLYKLIIRFLRTYHQEETTLIQLYELLIDIQILTDKNLVTQAWATIRKAKKKAKEYHYDIILLKLLILEKNLIRQHGKQEANSLMEENHEETNKYLDQFKVSLDLFKFYDNFFLLGRRRDLKVDIKKTAQELITNFPIINPTSFENRMLYHQAYSFYYKIIDNKDENWEFSASHLLTLIQYFGENPHLIDEYAVRYIYIIQNYLNCCAHLESFTEFPIYIKKLEEIPKKTQKRENVRYKLFEVKSYLNFIYYLSTEKFAEGSKILPELEKDFNKYKQKISLPHQISIPHYIGLLYFQSEYYDKAYTYFKNIVNSGNKGIKEDMRLFCRLVLAIIAYEQDNDSELDSICRHIIRKEEHKQHYSKQVAATLKRVFGALKDTKQRLFTELKEALEEREVYEHGRTQILIWLEKKI